MRLLELFNGTRSVGKVAEKLGFTVISLDIKMLILSVILWIGIILSILLHILILYGRLRHVQSIVEQRLPELEISTSPTKLY